MITVDILLSRTEDGYDTKLLTELEDRTHIVNIATMSGDLNFGSWGVKFYRIMVNVSGQISKANQKIVTRGGGSSHYCVSDTEEHADKCNSRSDMTILGEETIVQVKLNI